jgi:hypothetical protein
MPTILITDDDVATRTALSARLGSAAALQKPFDACDLLEAVDWSLALRHSPRIELAPEELREQLPARTFFGQAT